MVMSGREEKFHQGTSQEIMLRHYRDSLDLYLQLFHKALNCLCKVHFITWDNLDGLLIFATLEIKEDCRMLSFFYAFCRHLKIRRYPEKPNSF